MSVMKSAALTKVSQRIMYVVQENILFHDIIKYFIMCYICGNTVQVIVTVGFLLNCIFKT